MVMPFLNSQQQLSRLSVYDCTFLKDITCGLSLKHLTCVQAVVYCRALQIYDVFDLEEGYKSFKYQPPAFWAFVLCMKYKIKMDLVQLMLQEPIKLMRNEVLNFIRRNFLDITFAKVLIRFNHTLTDGDITELYMMSNKPNFDYLLGKIQGQASLSFSVFKYNVELYLEEQSTEFMEALETRLNPHDMGSWRLQAGAIACWNQGSNHADTVMK